MAKRLGPPKMRIGIAPDDPDRLDREMRFTEMMRKLERVNLTTAMEAMRRRTVRETMERDGRLL